MEFLVHLIPEIHLSLIHIYLVIQLTNGVRCNENDGSSLPFFPLEQPNLVLLDNRLPNGYGLDFLPYIWSNYPAVRIIMISGKDGATKDIALEAAAHIFLTKPFSTERLHNSVQALIN